jgi:hypothetical protein
MTSPAWIVCGWFTPDYRVWADKLIASFDAAGAPHDIVERPKLPGGWEANTMAKPLAVRDAMGGACQGRDLSRAGACGERVMGCR